MISAVACSALPANVAVPLRQRYGALPVIRRAPAVARGAPVRGLTFPVCAWPTSSSATSSL